ncbi:MAG: AAA family ATPase [Clostridiales bacterium]|nr:AAA family ATPase [Clostridiales bacterium]
MNIYLFSGPCGCGKTTLSTAFAPTLNAPVYLIHGDDFQAGFVQAQCPDVPRVAWENILPFNWDCIISVARRALALGVDVVIDYIVEEELPRVIALAREFDAALNYIVLTASKETLRARLEARGDAWLTARSLFLREKLRAMPENQGHLLDVTGLSVQEALEQVCMGQFHIDLS